MIENKVDMLLERLSDNFLRGISELVANPKEYSLDALKGVFSDIREHYERFLDWNYRRKGIQIVPNAVGDFVMIDRNRNELANCSRLPGKLICSTAGKPYLVD